MASEKKKCHYEILGIDRESSIDEIRSAYKKLALQRHPDKLIKTGISLDQATAAFQDLVNAYEVLSDPKERSFYDSHRSQILFSDPNSSQCPSSSGKVPNIPDLFSYFSNSVFSGFGDAGKGFFKVYGDVFGRVYGQEVWFARKFGLVEGSVKVAPLIGNLESYYVQVSAFYDYWLGFSSVMDFGWADEHDLREGGDRKARRVMEEENKKLRKKAKREYNDTVRRLAEYVKKRDQRVIDMQMKKKVEQEKKKEKERLRKEEEARVKLEKARMYEEPEWAKVEDVESLLEEEEDDGKKSDGEELYCVACKKKFKSDKQWQNHEKSKKHRQKVAEMKSGYGSDGLDSEGAMEVDVSADSEGVDTKESKNNHRNRAVKEGVQKSKKEVVRDEVGGDTEDAISDCIGSEAPSVEDKSNAQDGSSQLPVDVNLNIRRDGPLSDKPQNTANQWFKRKSTGKGERNMSVRDGGKGDANTKTRDASNWKAQKGLMVVRGSMARPPPQNLLDQLLLQLENLEGVIKPSCWVPTVALLSCAGVLLYYYY